MSGGGSRSRRCGSNKDDMLDGLLNETVKLSVGVRSDWAESSGRAGGSGDGRSGGSGGSGSRKEWKG